MSTLLAAYTFYDCGVARELNCFPSAVSKWVARVRRELLATEDPGSA